MELSREPATSPPAVLRNSFLITGLNEDEHHWQGSRISKGRLGIAG
jgi:hypothetical protein